MIDKAKSVESFMELIECINEGKLDSLSFELVFRDGTKVHLPIPDTIKPERPVLKLISNVQRCDSEKV